MLFEEVLPLLREGKKARIKVWHEDKHWIACTIAIDSKTRIPSLACINDSNGKLYENSKSWGIPRTVVMSDEWEIIE